MLILSCFLIDYITERIAEIFFLFFSVRYSQHRRRWLCPLEPRYPRVPKYPAGIPGPMVSRIHTYTIPERGHVSVQYSPSSFVFALLNIRERGKRDERLNAWRRSMRCILTTYRVFWMEIFVFECFLFPFLLFFTIVDLFWILKLCFSQLYWHVLLLKRNILIATTTFIRITFEQTYFWNYNNMRVIYRNDDAVLN